MVSLGIDQLMEAHHDVIAGRRVGLITNYAMTDSRLVPVIDRLAGDPTSQLVRLFGPEHGVLNAAREGEPVPFLEDPHTHLPAVSLYGDRHAPTREMLLDLDVLVIDLQDIGARYYTNPSTLYYAIEAAADANIPVVVLDRPNPLGGLVREGPGLDPEYRSFVGILSVPIRHGLTFGEEATLIRDRYFPSASVRVIPMAGWSRQMLWSDTGLPFVSASPNTSSFDMAMLYPGTCLFEGTNVSLGRGTTHPFEWIGAPFVDGHRLADRFNAEELPGVVARPIYFSPGRDPFQGEIMSGVQIHVTEPRKVLALQCGIVLLQAFQDLYSDDFVIGSLDDGPARPFFDLLAGGPALRQALLTGATAEYWKDAETFVSEFNQLVAPYLLYREE